MNGRDEETMDKIVNDLMTAAYGLPVTFQVVPFADPCIFVYVNDESTGSLIWAPEDPIDQDRKGWWQCSLISGRSAVITCHGDNLRAALARHLNEYIDARIGLATEPDGAHVREAREGLTA